MMKLKSNFPKIIVGSFLLLLLFNGVIAQPQERDSIPKNLDMGQYSFQDTAGNAVTIKDFKGKYVYMDLWASWCSPCIKEFPSFDSLKTQFKDKNIVFIQLSIDGGFKRWKFAMGMNNRKKGQWFVNNNKQFNKDLRIKYIPRYLLVDKKGKLVDAYMTRASDAETKTFLSKLKGI